MIVKFLVLGDLHGMKPEFLIDDFDAIIATGDICGDDIKKYMRQWIRYQQEGGDELNFYDFCPKWKTYLYDKLSLYKGKRIFRILNKKNKPVFLVPGNWDPTAQDGMPKWHRFYQDRESWNKLFQNKKNIFDIEAKKKTFKGITLIGHGSTSAPEPLRKTRINKIKDKDEKKIELYRYNFYTRLYKKFETWCKKSKNPVIILSHNAVYGTTLDEIQMKDNLASGLHCGSTVARKLVDKCQPSLAIGGHIHEGYGQEKIGNTICINAGYGGKTNIILKIDNKTGEVIEVQFLGENKVDL